MIKAITEKEIKELDRFVPLLHGEELRQYYYWKFYYDRDAFADFLLTHWKTKDVRKEDWTWDTIFVESPAFHTELDQFLDAEYNSNCIVARWHGKTTRVLIWTLHALVYKKYDAILYIASGGLGEDWVGKIQRELETNELLIWIYWNLAPTNTDNMKDKRLLSWRSKKIELVSTWQSPGHTMLETKSKGEAVRWYRKKKIKIIVDDFEEDREVQSKKVVLKNRERFLKTLLWVLMPWQSVTVIGTIISNMCLTAWLKTQAEWKTIEYKAVTEEKKPLWRAMWDAEALKLKRRQMGPAIFNQEFMNIPITKSDAVIKINWIRWYVKCPEKFDYILMAIDPIKKASEKSDYMGIAIIGVKWNDKYVLFSKGVKYSWKKARSYINAVYKQFKPDTVLYEENIEVGLLELLREDDGLPMQSFTSTNDKYIRLVNEQAQFENGYVLFRQDWDEEAVFQLTNFPDVENDDVMDAIVFCLRYARENPWQSAEETESSVFISK